MIIGKIDVKKIDKAKLFPGKKGTYLDVVLIETPNSEYGDYMICQGVSKEEREAGKKGAILGNAKRIGKKSESEYGSTEPSDRGNTNTPPETDDVPF